MNSGTQVDLDWAGEVAAQRGARDAGTGSASAWNGDARNGSAQLAHLTDEEILGLEPVGTGSTAGDSVIPRSPERPRKPSSIDDASTSEAQRDSSSKDGPRNDSAQGAAQHEVQANTANAGTPAMPQWMQAAAADPQHGAEAAQLWREHQEFRAAFTSPEEARAVRELLPGGVRDVLSLREATQSVERIDAALFSSDPRAQAEVVAELARANPAAFRSLFAEAAKFLVAGGMRMDAGNRQDFVTPSGARILSGDGMNGPENLERDSSSPDRAGAPRNDNVLDAAQATGHGRRDTSHESQITNDESRNFDRAAYTAFARATNDAVARDVRGAIGDTLARVLPDGVADGAARRIGDDIFQEIHRALAADRTLSEQVAAILRAPAAPGKPRFGNSEQQRVASLLVGRAKQLVPSVARRVIGEWTNSVLITSRAKAARQASAASRVDIAAPGGSSAAGGPPRPRGSSREVDYGSMSDEEILGM